MEDLGRPTDYKPEFDNQAYKLCLLGFTDKDLASYFEVTEQTINNWKKKQPSFFESLRRGKTLADAEVAESFYKSATGFEREIEEAKVISIGDFTQRVEIVKVKKYFPPERGAQLSWLKNRQPQKWRDKVDQEISVGITEVIMPKAIEDQESDQENDS